MYHQTLGLPLDVSTWAKASNDGFEQLAVKVGNLLTCSKNVARAVASRHPIIVCDEHQDANPAQHSVVMALHRAGVKLRVFGDPMQSIYGCGAVQEQQWSDLKRAANHYEKLDFPHRWTGASEELGQWVLRARETLKADGTVNLRANLPAGLKVIRAHNESLFHGRFKLSKESNGRLRAIIKAAPSMLILCPHNSTIRGLHSYWGREIPVWEGHSREILARLVPRRSEFEGLVGEVIRPV